jgi:hypothetical protein
MMKWKPNWAEAKQHFSDWWMHRGLVLTTEGFPATTPHEAVSDPFASATGPNDDHSYYHKAPEWRARVNHYLLAKNDYLADTLPLAHTDIGPGSLALLLGSEPGFSPDMFKRFVVPALAAQCEWLDFSMFHLDGHQCLCHLDHLLAIEPLDAIEWTADPKVPGGGSPEWYPLYRRILAAGKSVQTIGVKLDEVIPLLDAVGGNGMYISVNSNNDRAAFERVAARVEQYR